MTNIGNQRLLAPGEDVFAIPCNICLQYYVASTVGITKRNKHMGFTCESCRRQKDEEEQATESEEIAIREFLFDSALEAENVYNFLFDKLTV